MTPQQNRVHISTLATTSHAQPRCPVARRVLEICEAKPHVVAVREGDRSITYDGLRRDILTWANHLRALNLPDSSAVILSSPLDSSLPAAYIGARVLGLVPVLIDRQESNSRLNTVATAAGAGAILQTDTGSVHRIDCEPRSYPHQAGYVTFSSGTTGAPKGIIGNAAGLLAFLDWEAALVDLRSEDRISLLTSPSFDVIFRDLLLPLIRGASVNVAPRNVRFRPRAVPGWLRDEGITLTHAVPSLAMRWLEGGSTTNDTLRWTLFAGERLHPVHVLAWRRYARASRVVNLYGPSETTLAKFWYEVPETPPSVIPVGQPLPGASFWLDAQDQPNQVSIATPQGSLGYIEGTVTEDVGSALGRLGRLTVFHTEDRGQINNDGHLVILGRSDSLVKRRGRFVDLDRIHVAAMETGEISQCHVFQDETGDIVLVAAVPEPAAQPQLRVVLAAALGVDRPDAVVCVVSLPLLPGGKIDRARIRSQFGSLLSDSSET